MSRCLYVVRIEVKPESEQEWDRWHSEHHVPGVLAQPGFLNARKYKDVAPAADGWARYVTLYELESRADLDRYASSEAAKRLREEHVLAFGYVTRLQREVFEEVARREGGVVPNPPEASAPVGR